MRVCGLFTGALLYTSLLPSRADLLGVVHDVGEAAGDGVFDDRIHIFGRKLRRIVLKIHAPPPGSGLAAGSLSAPSGSTFPKSSYCERYVSSPVVILYVPNLVSEQRKEQESSTASTVSRVFPGPSLHLLQLKG